MCHDADNLTVPSVRWLGVHATDISRLVAALGVRATDISRLVAALGVRATDISRLVSALAVRATDIRLGSAFDAHASGINTLCHNPHRSRH